jgi:hypothetical protein
MWLTCFGATKYALWTTFIYPSFTVTVKQLCDFFLIRYFFWNQKEGIFGIETACAFLENQTFALF